MVFCLLSVLKMTVCLLESSGLHAHVRKCQLSGFRTSACRATQRRAYCSTGLQSEKHKSTGFEKRMFHITFIMCFLLCIFVCFLGGLFPLCLSIHAYAFLNGNFIGIALVLSLSFAICFPYVYCQIKLLG